MTVQVVKDTNAGFHLLKVSGQFLDSAQSQRHSVRLTRRQANNCPFLVLLVDYFFYFFYAGDSLRCPRCFLPPVTTSSKKSSLLYIGLVFPTKVRGFSPGP